MKGYKMVEPPSLVEVDEKKKERSFDASIAIDIGRLSEKLFNDIDSVPTPRSSSSSLMKSLSRKGIQRGGDAGEKKSSLPVAAGDTAGKQKTGGTAAMEKSMVHVAIDGELAGGTGRPTTPTHSGDGKRRMGINRRLAPVPWLDPKRVLLLFATLSSIGTLILLYFTLSMGKIGSGDASEW